MIYCIGDSHSSVFSGEERIQPCWPEKSNDLLPYFKSIRIGPATAYNLSSKIKMIDKILNKLKPAKSDYVMYCFGEVDIRAHLINQATLQKIDLVKIVDECTERYLKTIHKINNKDSKVIIYGPIASWSETKKYMGPSFGSNIERNFVTFLFNENLKVKCKVFGFYYLSIFNEMLNDDYTTNEYFLDDWDDSHIHLKQNAMPLIITKLKNLNIL